MKFTIGTVVLLVQSGLLAVGAPEAEGRGPAYNVGHILGGALVPNMAAWVLPAEGGAGMVMIQVTKAPTVTERSLLAFGRGVRKGVIKAGGVTVLEDTVAWSGPRRATVIVCVETGSPGRDDDLRFVRAGLAVGR